MHFHLPKPLHGWRELLGEVGIIVIGVLIALGAEQLVEDWRWHNQAEEARAALRAELAEDNLPQAYARAAFTPCLQAKLQLLQTALTDHMDRSRFAALADAYLPPLRTWDDEAWKAVITSGVLSHSGSGELIEWSLPYRLIPGLASGNNAERDDLVNLRSISHAGGQLSPAEQDRVTVALEHLRVDTWHMQGASMLLIGAAREAGVAMTNKQKQDVLSEVRREWGTCVKAPASIAYSTSQGSEPYSSASKRPSG